MATMSALRSHVRGGPETLTFERAPVPAPARGEVLVAVRAAAITFAELSWDETWTRDGHDRTPVIPSHEFSGVVVGLGESAAGPAEGEEVYGLVPFDRDGAAAEFVVAPADHVALKPRTVSFTVAAALPLAGLTAWQALVDHAALASGERVLIHGGAGGVGAFAVQLAVSLQADVTVTCLHDDVDFVLALGAHRVIDVTEEAFDATPDQYDVVLDTVGGATLKRSFPVLHRGGRLVTLQAPPSPELCEQYGVKGIFFIVVADESHLERLAGLVDAGHLQVSIAATYALEDGRAAFESGAAARRPAGKTVLVVR